MNFHSISVGNFKAFGQPAQNIPIKPITLIFGPNSAGKSSLLHFILWLNHIVKTGEFDVRYPTASGRSIDLGGFSQAVYRHASPERIMVGIEILASNIPVSLRDCLCIKKSITLEMSYGCVRHGIWNSEPRLMDFRINIDDQQLLKAVANRDYLKIVSCDFDLIKKNKHAYVEPANLSSKAIDAAKEIVGMIKEEKISSDMAQELLFDGMFDDVSLGGDPWMPHKLSFSGNESGQASTHELFVIDQVIQFSHQFASEKLKSIKYVPPLRELPPRHFDASGADEVWSHLLDLVLLRKVNQWLQNDVFKSKYELVVSEFFSRALLEEKLPHEIRSQIVMASLPDPGSYRNGEDFTIAEKLVDVIDQLKGIYENTDKEEILESFPGQKESMYDCAASELRRDNKEFHDKISYEQSRRISDDQICLDDWIGSEELENKGAYATEIFSLWAANQPQVLNVFNDASFGCTDTSAHWFLNHISSSKGDVRREIHLKDRKNGTTVSLQDVGVGISQVLPVIINAIALQNKTIAIEQPEIHIHPALQAEIGDLFIQSSLGENKNTFLLETHSEHLILRILRRIRETTEQDFSDWPEELKSACPNGIRPEDVAVLYVKPGEEGAEVTNLRINELGEFIDEWPNGFFEERIREIF